MEWAVGIKEIAPFHLLLGSEPPIIVLFQNLIQKKNMMGKRKFKLHVGWNQHNMNLMVTLSISQMCSRKGARVIVKCRLLKMYRDPLSLMLCTSLTPFKQKQVFCLSGLEGLSLQPFICTSSVLCAILDNIIVAEHFFLSLSQVMCSPVWRVLNLYGSSKLQKEWVLWMHSLFWGEFCLLPYHYNVK